MSYFLWNLAKTKENNKNAKRDNLNSEALKIQDIPPEPETGL